jgi:hypothetical protein
MVLQTLDVRTLSSKVLTSNFVLKFNDFRAAEVTIRLEKVSSFSAIHEGDGL